MDTTKAVTHVSLCAGYGGIDLGLKRAIPNLRTVAFSEIEGFACANLVAKMEAGLLDAAPIWTNLKTFPWAEFRGRVDILSGGYPCQPFSAAGKRLGTDDPRHLWPFIADGIRIMQPRVCFFENVEGHISLGLRAVIEELGSIGYKTTWGIFSAREVGAPHQRKRVFIMAHTADWGGQSLHDWNAKPTDAISCRSWPSRPSEPQHEWEPPRVVANSASERTVHGQQLRGEECRQGRALPCESDESGEGVGNTIVHGHATSQISRGISKSKAEGGMQEFEGGSASVANSNSIKSSEGRGDNGEMLEVSARERTDECATLSGRESELRGEVVANSLRSRGKESGFQSADILTESGRGDTQVVGNAEVPGCGRLDDEQGKIGNREARGHSDWSSHPEQQKQWQAEPPLGRDADGSTSGMDYAKLCISGDNRTDELRLLGNGVVPATATRAFLTLMEELKELK